MRRSCKVTTKFATDAKQRRLAALLQAYRACVQKFIVILWALPSEEFDLNKKTLELVDAGRLSERFKSNALKQAVEIVKSTRLSGTVKPNSKPPEFKGSIILDAKFVNVEDKKKSTGNPFDLVVRISSLSKGKKIVIPTCRTKPINKWMNKAGAKFIQGCALSEDSLVLWVEIPDGDIPFAPPVEAVVSGEDLGQNKLMTHNTAPGDQRWGKTAYGGLKYKKLQAAIRRCKPGSNHHKRLLAERDHVIGRALNAIPWAHIDVIGHEDLTGIMQGKVLSKEFRRRSSPWAHRLLVDRLDHKCAEHRVLRVIVSPHNTSRCCPNVNCRCVSRLNRKGELFRCVACGHTEDADSVGAGNIRIRTLKTLEARRAWLAKHPDSANKTYLPTRRSLASRRRPKRK